mmetsp:Transcript_37135/g.54615  ORF Transcript_37135/g.54615 Transcript_37135/m.54615 type:complete len:230 (+) Transcript_37135:23-712(+)
MDEALVTSKKPFSLTFVQYEEGDSLGWICALLALAPPFAIVSYLSVMLARRELHTVSTLVGQLLCVGLNIILKNVFAESRPDGSDKDDHGMPSNHAQFSFYFCTYLSLFVLFRVQRNQCGPYMWWKYALVSILMGGAVAVSLSRVYLRYHTFAQVGVGAVFGTLFAFFWYALTVQVFMPFLFGRIENMAICEILYVRDSSHGGEAFHDVWKEEWKLNRQLLVDRKKKIS